MKTELTVKRGKFKGCTIADLHVIAEFHKIVMDYIKMTKLLNTLDPEEK